MSDETPTATADGGCSCGYRAGSRPTQISCGNGQCPFVRQDDDLGLYDDDPFVSDSFLRYNNPT